MNFPPILHSHFIIRPCILAFSVIHLDLAYCNALRSYNSFVIGAL